MFLILSLRRDQYLTLSASNSTFVGAVNIYDEAPNPIHVFKVLITRPFMQIPTCLVSGFSLPGNEKPLTSIGSIAVMKKLIPWFFKSRSLHQI